MKSLSVFIVGSGLFISLSATAKVQTSASALSIDEQVIKVAMDKDQHDAAVAFCQDLFQAKQLGAGYTKRAFVIGCLKKIIVGVDPTN